MRTAVASISSDSSVNKLSVSSNNLIAVPYDNRNVRIFDLSGSRLARLPRSSHQVRFTSDRLNDIMLLIGYRVTPGW